MSTLNFEHSIWFIPLCLIIGAGFSYLLYSKNNPWGTTANRCLAALRFVLFTLLAILLLNPLLKQFTQHIEKPMVVIALDNSESMLNDLDSLEINQLLENVGQLKADLIKDDYTVEIQTLSGTAGDLPQVVFNEKTSNLKTWLDEIQSQKEGMNLASIYLFSDGIFNQGISPSYFPYGFKVNTVGLGDTLQKEDLVLKNVFCNKIAYKGNRFPILAEVINFGFQNQKSEVQIWSGGKLVDSKTIEFKKSRELQSVNLEATSDKEGYRQLTVVVRPLNDEISSINNRKNVFVDVVDGRQKILIIAPAPHPDIKTLSAVIGKNDNYELEVYIPGFSDFKNGKYDLVISHNTYDRWNRCKKVSDDLKAQGVPFFQIIGKVSQLTTLSLEEPHLKIIQQRNQRDNIIGSLNADFKKFTISDIDPQALSNFPPLNVPYANYEISPSAEVLLYQRVGTVTTDKPLLFLVEENDKKAGYLLAEDIWKWRMQEYALMDHSKTFDALFLKVIQYLSTKVDKRKFRFYTDQTEYFTNDLIQFHAEMYNDIYERIYNEEIKVVISNEDGFRQEASFIPASPYATLDLSGFEEGTYNYLAKVTLNGQNETASGVFVVKELQLEQIDLVAKFDILRQMAEISGGAFYNYSQDFQKILDEAKSGNDKSIVHTEEEILPLVNVGWLLAVLILIATTEWLTRKYLGGY